MLQKSSCFKLHSHILSALALVLFIGCAPTHAEDRLLINGAGATFPFPLYSRWFFEYQKVDPLVVFNYQSIGSGGGVRQLLAETVDFGASDAPMTDAQLKAAKEKTKHDVVHVPATMGAVVLSYNLPTLKKPLKLDGELITDIFLGKIKKWNDPRILALNSDEIFPDLYIFVAYRADGSGTTAVFTDYLSKVSEIWKKKVGKNTSVKWPVGIGGKGNEGVSGLLKQTEGSLGYIELVYAQSNHLSYAQIKNQENIFITPSAESVTEAAKAFEKEMPEDFRISITNAKGKKAYPISSFTYLLTFQTLTGKKAQPLKDFYKWAMRDGQKFSPALGYASLPLTLTSKVLKRIDQLEVKP